MPEQPFDWTTVRLKCECGRDMVVRQNRDNGSRFMGCQGWPNDCQNTAPLPAYAILRAQGAAELPGFDAVGRLTAGC